MDLDSIPADLLELQTRFAHWRATRKYDTAGELIKPVQAVPSASRM
jgi:hypothetical protein